MMQRHVVEPGNPLALGAYCTEKGVQFSLFSRHATAVSLLLFDKSSDLVPVEVHQLDPEQHKTGDIWHVLVLGLGCGQLYVYRVDGPYIPSEGHRFDPDAWLLDPYAKAFVPNGSWRGWNRQGTPKCLVVDPQFDWQGDKPLNYPMKDCVIYETHLAGLTRHPSTRSKHPAVKNPGTYLGVVGMIPYLKELGITSLEFLPVQEFNPEDNMNTVPGGNAGLLGNFWGYNTVGFFAPAGTYATNTSKGSQVVEFKTMVRELHKAGFEVILDVVFNHTAEGNELGPAFSFKGLDNSIYYMLSENKRSYRNFSGCGNTLNCNHPVVRSMILDCIRYWVLDMHVDGFRFDLGSILGRDTHGELLSNPPVIEMLAEDPLLRNTKLIAEAWDAAGGYQVGSFHGERWAEWNDRFRDDLRRFWRNDPGMVPALAMRVSGSSDLYNSNGRKPYHSINFITSHDGFTLNDLVSYERKHNLANGENNRDGNDNNNSWNFGVEGPSRDPTVEALRNRMVKNLLASLAISSGTPMLLAGDEFRRTQQGNNNAYCQDNSISWHDWTLLDQHQDILQFCSTLIHFRHRHRVFTRSDFFSGVDANDNGAPDITWFDEHAKPINWARRDNVLAVLIDGHRSETQSDIDDNDIYLLFNATSAPIGFTLPKPPSKTYWCVKLDTAMDPPIHDQGDFGLLDSQETYVVQPRSLVVLVSKR